jgi:hypothetical protein
MGYLGQRGVITDALRALVDHHLQLLRRVRFLPDPLFPTHSLRRQLEGSAIKRHGKLIEAAIIETLTAEPDYRVWRETKFIVPAAADHAVQSQQPAEIAVTRLPYGSAGRALQIDLMTYRVSRRRLGAYEIKRGLGRHDAGKLRSLRRDIFGVQTTLASYGERRGGIAVDEAISRVIFYYGARSLPPAWSLIGTELDDHFGCRVQRVVEAMTEYFRFRLEDFIDGLDDLRPETRQLALELLRE